MANNTTSFPTDPENVRNGIPAHDPIVSRDLRNRVEWATKIVIVPGISLVGVAGCVLTIMVLRRHGFGKSTINIILLGLAVFDLNFLVGHNNIPLILHHYHRGIGFYFSPAVSYTLFVMHGVFKFLQFWGGSCSLSIPVLITVDRLVAVFLPLHFRSIITPKRTWMALVVLCSINIPLSMYSAVEYGYIYGVDNITNASFGRIIAPSYYDTYQSRSTDPFCIVYFILHTILIVAVVFIGYAAIGIKLRVSARKRRAMTGPKTTATTSMEDNQVNPPAFKSQTTRSLLAVCTAYLITQFCASLTLFLVPLQYRNLTTITEEACMIVYCINSTCKFFIYITLNPRFNHTFKTMLGLKVPSRF